MAKQGYEGAARRPALQAGAAASGMRRVIVGKETGDDMNNPHAPIHTYIDPDGEFAGEVVKTNAKNFVVEYPQERYDAHMKEHTGRAVALVSGAGRVGIPNELDSSHKEGSRVEIKDSGLTNRDIASMPKISNDG